MALEFREDIHEYRVNGRVLPSVTTVLGILQDFGAVPADVLARAAEFGSHVHQAVDLDNQGVLDEDALDPALRPYVTDWRQFLIDTDGRVVGSELRMADPALGFAGTADAVIKIKGKPVLVDVKTGLVPRTVGPQTAAYAHLFNLLAPLTMRVKRRLCVQLTGEGYRMTECKNPADWSVFMSCLNILRFKNAA